MKEMLETFKERKKIYGDNWERIGPVLAALFPDGVTLETADDHNQYHLFMMIMVKVTRVATTDVKHQDSAHDIAVYAAMLDSLLRPTCDGNCSRCMEDHGEIECNIKKDQK
jgi:hypothetical protein